MIYIKNRYTGDVILSIKKPERSDLPESYLRGANLYGIDGKKIVVLYCHKHPMYIVDGYVRVGCIYMTVQSFLKKCQRLGEKYDYTQDEIDLYKSTVRLYVRENN